MPADDLKIQVRLPRDLHAQLVASAERHVRSLNGEIVAAIRRGQGDTAVPAMTPADDAGQRFVVRRLAESSGLLPYVVIDRQYQFSQRSFGTHEEALDIADEWNRNYPQAPTPQPALVS